MFANLLGHSSNNFHLIKSIHDSMEQVRHGMRFYENMCKPFSIEVGGIYQKCGTDNTYRITSIQKCQRVDKDGKLQPSKDIFLSRVSGKISIIPMKVTLEDFMVHYV